MIDSNLPPKFCLEHPSMLLGYGKACIERALNQRLAVKEGEAVGDISKANWPFPYDKTFKAIGNAVHIEGGSLAISVMKFREAFGPLPTHPVSDAQQAKDAALVVGQVFDQETVWEKIVRDYSCFGGVESLSSRDLFNVTWWFARYGFSTTKQEEV